MESKSTEGVLSTAYDTKIPKGINLYNDGHVIKIFMSAL